MKNHALVFLFLVTLVADAAQAGAKLNVLVVTGGHGFDRGSFFQVFSDNPEITFTEAKQNKDADAYERDDLLNHDVLVLYDMPKTITDTQKAKFLSLFNKGVELVVLHHALVSYQHWPEYERIIGGHYPEDDGKSGAQGIQAGGVEQISHRMPRRVDQDLAQRRSRGRSQRQPQYVRLHRFASPRRRAKRQAAPGPISKYSPERNLIHWRILPNPVPLFFVE